MARCTQEALLLVAAGSIRRPVDAADSAGSPEPGPRPVRWRRGAYLETARGKMRSAAQWHRPVHEQGIPRPEGDPRRRKEMAPRLDRRHVSLVQRSALGRSRRVPDGPGLLRCAEDVRRDGVRETEGPV